ncbi:cutinase-2 [Colletotrichum orchidophilum]|uniref:cutinase n=1 Tax=Colletotrichum orchidophilum TaxID=1209926 RepID=A0A1G4BMB9_9PEZI|nr:cutinase-2 [Colletotrichum orchidophilum]OHF02457.1 cutinase-2 [Colletotrichum orchidophilum]
MKRSTAVILALQYLLTLGLARVILQSDHAEEGGQPAHALKARKQVSSDDGVVENEARDGACKDIMFFFIRGSTQNSNMGRQPGPQLATYLRSALKPDKIAVQGIEYAATLQGNLCLSSGLCPGDETAKAASQIKDYMDKCEKSDVIVGGYSQGAAVLSKVISGRLEPNYKQRIVAAVTFGSTVQKQNKKKIPGLAPEKVRMFCNDDDPVCRNGFTIGAVMSGHRDYRKAAKAAAEFFVQKLAADNNWPKVPVISDIDLSQFTDVGFTFGQIYRGAPAGTSTPFNDATKLALLDSVGVVSIFGRGAARVDALGVKMDGLKVPQEHGGGGGDYKELRLGEGEYWVKAEMCNGQKKGKDRVGYFRATTNLSRYLEIGTKTKDRCTIYVPGDGHSFVGMHGESGEEVDSVGFIEYPQRDETTR